MSKEEWWEKQRERFLKFAEREEDEIVRSEIISHMKEWFPRDSDVLVLGCSKGQFIKELQFKGNSVTVVDFPEIVEELEEKGRCKGCTFEGLNIDKNFLGFEDDFDFVLMDNALEHCIHDYGVICEIYKSLKDLGEAVVIVPSREVREEDKYHLRSYNLLELKKLFQIADFQILDLKTIPKGNMIVVKRYG